MSNTNKSARSIVLASTKGGVGRSTLSLMLACTYASQGQKVTLVAERKDSASAAGLCRIFFGDADWPFSTIEYSETDEVSQLVAKAKNVSDRIIIDADRHVLSRNIAALATTDLVIVPSRFSVADVGPAVSLIRELNEFGCSKNVKFLFTSDGRDNLKFAKEIRREVLEAGVKLLGRDMEDLGRFDSEMTKRKTKTARMRYLVEASEAGELIDRIEFFFTGSESDLARA